MDLDPRAILLHLNSLGYKNVTSEQLKEFIRDLKLLIKYESKYSIKEQSAANNVNLFSNLMKNYKKKHQEHEKEQSRVGVLKENDNGSRKKSATVAITINENREAKSSKPERTTNNLNRADENVKENIPASKQPIDAKKIQKSSNNRVCSGKMIRNTPTDLYQKYKEDWDRFKNFVPGENSREDVRQAVRQKLQHRPVSATKTYLCFINDRKIIKRL